MSKSLSERITCGHCYNVAPMEIVGTVADTTSFVEDHGHSYEQGDHYEVLKCPACSKVNITTYFWHDYMDSPEETTTELIYPSNNRTPLGLPQVILNTYQAAEKIKSIDIEIYAITLRKILELVCEDKKAVGKVLVNKLDNLAKRGEIPSNLVKVAKGLKDFGNVGAHPGIGKLSAKDIPIAEALCRAILEYIYSAPYLAQLAENKLKAIKSK